jgi:hypothetical protein
MKTLSDDNFDWELIDSDPNIKSNTFFSKTNFLPNILFFKNSSTYKFVSYLPISFETAILSLGTSSSTFNLELFELLNSKELNYFNHSYLKEHFPGSVSNQRGNVIHENIFKLKSLSFRSSLDTTTSYLQDESNWIRIVRPLFDSKENLKKWNEPKKMEFEDRTIECTFLPNFMKFKLTKVSENLTKYTFIHSNPFRFLI